MSGRLLVRIATAAILALAILLPVTSLAAPPPGSKVIVVLNDDVANPGAAASEIAQRHRGRLGFVYQHALKGFSIEVPTQALLGISRDPRVAYIEPDQLVYTAEIPTGVDRMEVDKHEPAGIGTGTAIDVDVAIIDTGIDVDHPDLNVVGGVDCSSSLFWVVCAEGTFADGHGHGTHVAGTVGALDNGSGVVGVAPGARLWGVKVLTDSGSGYMSAIVGGIDWVTARANTIEVANMSLGCECTSSAMNAALTNSTNAGVVYVAAAGNNASDAATFNPASHPQVIAVSAVADFDGLAGGAGQPTCRADVDDTFADFSNYGSVVDIAAPGVCIESTWPGGGYHTISGTSMASPHAAGAAALFIVENNVPQNSNRWSTVLAGLQSSDWSVPQSDACGFTEGISNERFLVLEACDFAGDPGDPVGDPPTVSIESPADGTTVSGTVLIEVDADDSDDSVGSLDVDVSINSGAWFTATYNGATGFYEWDWDSTTVADGEHTITARATDSDGNLTTSGAITVTVDNVDEPPTATFTNPLNGDTVSGDVLLSAVASDDVGVVHVEFQVNLVVVGTDADGSDGWSVPWDSTTIANGSYFFHAIAMDTAGQEWGEAIIVTVDNGTADPDDPPTINVTSPTGGSTVDGTVTVTADASDDNGVQQVEFFVGGSSIGVDTDGADGWSAHWDTTSYADGDHTIGATATDTAGQTADDSITVTVANDTGSGDPTTMHVADLSATSVNDGRTWTAMVTILILDDQGNPVDSATVSGTWKGSVNTAANCTTGADGTCTVSVSGIHKRNSSVSFTVDIITHAMLTYSASDNIESSIVVNKP